MICPAPRQKLLQGFSIWNQNSFGSLTKSCWKCKYLKYTWPLPQRKIQWQDKTKRKHQTKIAKRHRIIITESHTKKPNTKRITSQSSSSEVLALGHHQSPWKMLSTIKINIVKIIINTLVDLKVAFYFIFMKTALTNFITHQRSLHHQSS